MRKNGKHYSAEEWVDFVMEQLAQNRLSEMQGHLEAGCKKCSEMASLWNRVSKVASRETTLEPPASSVQHVRQAFTILANSKDAQIPRLAFDSLWQPALAGVRSASATSRHVMYAAGRMSIDMHLEPEPRSERINLAGQVSLATAQGRDYPPIPVAVLGKTGRLAATTTNGFGEFHLAFIPEQGLQISFAIAGKKEIVIPLDSSVGRGR
ncbi:MAG: hypothetical protein WB607_02765 [Candidatus Acidiferrum sp.]